MIALARAPGTKQRRDTRMYEDESLEPTTVDADAESDSAEAAEEV